MSDEFLIEDLLIRRAMGESLTPAELARLHEAHAAGPDARAAQRDIEQSLVALALSTRATPPASLRARVFASAIPVRATRARRWPLALAASIALLAVAVSAALFEQNRQLRLASEQQNQAARMLLEPNVVLSYRLRGKAGAEEASGVVLLDLDAKRASISMRDLPPLPEGQAYYLWAELGGRYVPCGHFSPRDDGGLLTQFVIPVDSYTEPITRLVMTVERGDDATQPTGGIVMSSS